MPKSTESLSSVFSGCRDSYPMPVVVRFELRQLQEPDRVSETIDQTNLLLDLLDDAQPMLEFEPSIFKSMIKEITVYPEKFSFVLSNGLVLCEMRR